MSLIPLLFSAHSSLFIYFFFSLSLRLFYKNLSSLFGCMHVREDSMARGHKPQFIPMATARRAYFPPLHRTHRTHRRVLNFSVGFFVHFRSIVDQQLHFLCRNISFHRSQWRLLPRFHLILAGTTVYPNAENPLSYLFSNFIVFINCAPCAAEKAMASALLLGLYR